MEGETMNVNNFGLVRSMGSQDASQVKEVNSSNKFFWMLNKYGRKVPVHVALEGEKLKKGYVHTDRVIYSDDMSKRVVAPTPVTPAEAMAKMAEKMAESTEKMAQAISGQEQVVTETVTSTDVPVFPRKRGGRPKKVKAVEAE